MRLFNSLRQRLIIIIGRIMKIYTIFILLIVAIYPSFAQLQSDDSDKVWAIVMPETKCFDVDMKDAYLFQIRDSLITGFIRNPGSWKFRVDEISFRGADSASFSIVSGFPKYVVQAGNAEDCEFRFIPRRLGKHSAEIVIITQADTLIQTIIGNGIEKKIFVKNRIIDFGKVYIGEKKDTLKALTIKNISSTPVEITKTELIGPNKADFEILSGGGTFNLAPNETHKMDLRFTAREKGLTNTNIEFRYRGGGESFFVKLFGEGVKPKYKCGETYFEYPDFSNPDKLILVGDARQIADDLRLTTDANHLTGAMWYETKAPVAQGFTTKFQFRLSEGDNRQGDDGSAPGADGLAFVIQNTGNRELGYTGGGLGYHRIENALAVEFDLFTNDNKQIEDFYDPNGNHVAVQSGGIDKISSKHTDEYCLGVSKYIDNIYADGRIYNVKIEYNIEPGVMNVYLGEEDSLESPVLVVSELVLEDILDLDDNIGAFVGITAATGNAVEKHDILNWYFCPFDTNTYVEDVEEPLNNHIELNVFPNPVYGSATIKYAIPKDELVKIEILDIFGRIIEMPVDGIHQTGLYSLTWNPRNISGGVYFCLMTAGDKKIMTKLFLLNGKLR